MSKIDRASLVTFYHRLGSSDGNIFENTFNDEPMTVQLGCGEMAEGLELALLGLDEGDEQTLDIGPDLALGLNDETLIRSVTRSEFDPEIEIQQGLIIEFSTAEGEVIPGTILEITDEEVQVDLNHPLAGQIVRYQVKIVEVINSLENQALH